MPLRGRRRRGPNLAVGKFKGQAATQPSGLQRDSPGRRAVRFHFQRLNQRHSGVLRYDFRRSTHCRQVHSALRPGRLAICDRDLREVGWQPQINASIHRGEHLYLLGQLADLVINGAWNNRCGPGGSARRLHHSSRSEVRGFFSSRWGRNRLDTRGKDHLLPGIVPPLSG